MKQFLLDTNIVIYILNGDPYFVESLNKFKDASFFISIATWIEALAGSLRHGKSVDELTEDLSSLPRLQLDEKVGRTAALLIQNNIKRRQKRNFQDSVIAATAIANDMPLITNDEKDFRQFKGLKIISPKVRR